METEERTRHFFFERLGVDTEITAVRWGLVGRARRRLVRPASPPSLRAQLVLMVSVFLLGGVASALVFVGVWRHTAADENQARAAQLAVGQSLQATRRKLANTQADLAISRAALKRVRAGRTAATAELTGLRRINSRAATSIPPRLQTITNNADLLARQSGKLGSALATLNDYLRNASATGVDPAFLAAQIRYLANATATTTATANALAQQARRAQASTATLLQKP